VASWERVRRVQFEALTRAICQSFIDTGVCKVFWVVGYWGLGEGRGREGLGGFTGIFIELFDFNGILCCFIFDRLGQSPVLAALDAEFFDLEGFGDAFAFGGAGANVVEEASVWAVLIAVIYVGGVGRMILTFPVQGLDCVLVAEDVELDFAWCEVYPVESDCRRIVEAMG